MKKIRILVSEFITGGGLIEMADRPNLSAIESLPDSLILEGEMMLRSLVMDLADIEGIEVWITRDPRIDDSRFSKDSGFSKDINVRNIKADYFSEFKSLCEQVDAVLPIAPESGGILERLNRSVLACRKILLGTDPETVRACASKFETAAKLVENHIPVVETVLAGSTFPDSVNGWVIKPNEGVGSEQVYFSQSKNEIIDFVSKIDSPIIQPYLPGIPASLSIMCRNGECVVIGYNEQMISDFQQEQNSTKLQLKYKGSKVNSLTDYRSILDQLAASVAKVFPGLWGYVGLDLIIVEGEPVMLEINPRLTTSYSGLRESTGINPAVMILNLLENKLSEKQSLENIPLSNFKAVEVFVPA